MGYENPVEGRVMNKYVIGNNIHVRLKIRKITQRQMAADLGMSEHTISDYMNGQRWPQVPKLYQMAKYLGCTMDDLMKGVDE